MTAGQRSGVTAGGRSFIEGTVPFLGIRPLKQGDRWSQVAAKPGLTVVHYMHSANCPPISLDTPLYFIFLKKDKIKS